MHDDGCAQHRVSRELKNMHDDGCAQRRVSREEQVRRTSEVRRTSRRKEYQYTATVLAVQASFSIGESSLISYRCDRLNIQNGRDKMTTTEERMKILRMIEEGKITAEEGARLLAALDRVTDGQMQAPHTGRHARFMRVIVTDSITGQQKVGVNVPLGLVTFGLRFVPEGARQHVQSLQDAIDAGRTGRIIDIVDEHEGQRVEILIE